MVKKIVCFFMFFCFVAGNLTVAKAEEEQKLYQKEKFIELKELSLKDLEERASEEDVYAKTELAIRLFLGKGVEKNKQRAVKLFKEAAEENEALAQTNLGNFALYGINQEKDIKKAIEWFEKAQKQQQSSAMYKLGMIKIRGLSSPLKIADSIKLIIKAARKGNPKAQYILANIYYYGFNVEKNVKKAGHWYHKAAKKGHLFSEIALVRLFFRRDLNPDAESFLLLKWNDMAHKGNHWAKYYLGLSYAIRAMEFDAKKCLKWLILASQEGNNLASRKIASLKRREKITQEDIDQGKQEAKAWKAKQLQKVLDAKQSEENEKKQSKQQ